MGATGGAGTTYPSGTPEFTPGFQWGSCYSIFSFICMFCTFFSHCVVCSSSIYGFWLPLWYPQALLNKDRFVNTVKPWNKVQLYEISVKSTCLNWSPGYLSTNMSTNEVKFSKVSV
jgi:hypothetical protein